MRTNRRTLGVALCAIALATVAATGVTAANTPAPAGSGTELIDPEWTPLALRSDTVTLMVQLKGDPVALVQAQKGRKLDKSEKAAAKAEIKAAQQAPIAAIERLGGTVVADYQMAYNGLRVRIDRRDASELEKLPGVTGVRPVEVFELDNARGVPMIGAPQAWGGLSGLHGENVKIAIIDTGIDYTHADFAGPGTPAAYVAANATDTLPADPALFGPAAPRVKGGWDFVGDSYNASASAGSPALTPHPDPNPLDCNGHGSHVAGTAAGSGVLANGTTYNGSYNASTVSGNSWTIGPGVAPKADLYALRVFGCSGSTDVTVDAIEWAVENDMDVINMSLGSPLGSGDDPSAVASTNAAKAGVIVVTSAGNNGANAYIGGSPGTATGSIATAANDAVPSTPGATLTMTPPAGGKPTVQAINANGFQFAAFTDDIAIVGDNPATPAVEIGLGCSRAEYLAAGVSGKIAVTRRGTCARVARAIFGQQEGAVAVVMVNNANVLPPFEGPITSNPDTGEQYVVTIPFLGVSLADQSAFAPGQSAAVNPINLANTNFSGFASFTSRGPRNGDSAMKPDVTAPGQSVISVGNGTGNGLAIISGTSMASPHNAGMAALVRQARPGWDVADIKAAIVNTADPAGVGGILSYQTTRGGTGLINAVRSTSTNVIARANSGDKLEVAASFGFKELSGDFSGTKAIKVINRGSQPATFNVSTALPQGRPHSVSVNRSSITVQGGAQAEVILKLDVPAATVGSAAAFREVSGLVLFSPASSSDNGGIALRVPYLLVPRALSNIDGAWRKPWVPGMLENSVDVTNKNGTIPGDADFYAWGLDDKRDKGQLPNDARAIGVQSFDFGGPQLIVFAVSTWDRWSNASNNEFDIYVDVDLDGRDDYIVVGADNGAVTTGTFDGQMRAFVFSTRSAGASTVASAVAPTDGSTALLPILSTQLCRAGEPCLNVANPRFGYTAVAFDVKTEAVDVVSGEARFNPWTNAISTGGFVGGLAPGGTGNVPIVVNAAEWQQTPARGVMIVGQDNAAGPGEALLMDLGGR